MEKKPQIVEFHTLPIPLDRDLFVRNLLREMTQSLVDELGEEKAEQFVHRIGSATGSQFNTYYRAALKTLSLARGEVAAALVDLKRRIQGDFFIIEQSDDKIVLGNRACPFGAKVLDRPALCMMTSAVFGSIASQNGGYAKVELKETIARRAAQCRVVVHVKKTAEARQAAGREYLAPR